MSWDGLRTPGARQDRWTGRALGLALIVAFSAVAAQDAALAQEVASPPMSAAAPASGEPAAAPPSAVPASRACSTAASTPSSPPAEAPPPSAGPGPAPNAAPIAATASSAPPEPAAAPTPALAAPSAAVEPAKPGILPHDLSPLGMFLAADVIVKSVLIGLALASLMTWTVWLAKLVEIGGGRRRLRRELAGLTGERSLAAAAASFSGRSTTVGRLIDAAALELRLSSDVTTRAGLRDRVSSRLADIEAEAIRRARLGTGLLASIGATAPFIGLFGTVWGIMNSFIGISKAQTTNLAVVAPGIAEALLATALGLVAAIPAVLFYNHLARAIAGKKALVREAASEVERLVSRDLDRSHHGAPHLRSAYAAE